MKLHALHGEAPVAEPHDLAVLRARGDLQLSGEALFQDHEGVIAGRLEVLRQRGEDTVAVVTDVRRLAVHLLLRSRHRAPEGLADGLVTEAHAENGDAGVEATDEVEGDAGVVRRAWPRRDHDAFGPEALHLVHRDLVVARHLHGRAELPRYWTRL